MIKVERDLGFVCRDAQPTGAKLDHPDNGMHIDIDTNTLVMSQELPSDTGQSFLEAVKRVSVIAHALFRPEATYYNGFAAKKFREYATEDQVFAASLNCGSSYYLQMADLLGLTPLHQTMICAFSAGSYELQIDLKPLAFSSTKSQLRGYGFGASETQKGIIDRWNAKAGKQLPAGYALALEVDLRERNPPDGALDTHFAELVKLLERAEASLTLTA